MFLTCGYLSDLKHLILLACIPAQEQQIWLGLQGICNLCSLLEWQQKAKWDFPQCHNYVRNLFCQVNAPIGQACQ